MISGYSSVARTLTAGLASRLVREMLFRSGWEKCCGRHFSAVGSGLADDEGRRPCVVMMTRVGKECRPLRTFVAGFTAAGCDVLVVEGRPGRELRDARAGVAAARGLASVDPGRVVLWGAGPAAPAVFAAAERGVSLVLALAPSGATGRPARASCPALVQVEGGGPAVFRDAGWPPDAVVRRYAVDVDDPFGVSSLAAILRDQVDFVVSHLRPTPSPVEVLAAG